MKKTISLIAILFFVSILTGCGSTAAVTTQTNATMIATTQATTVATTAVTTTTTATSITTATTKISTTTMSNSVFDSSKVKSQLKISEYSWVSGKYRYVVLVIKNNSNFNLAAEVKMTFLDASGNLVGARTDDERAFESGQEMMFTFMNESFNSYKYNIDLKEESYYDSVLSSLKYTKNITKNKVVFSVTNSGVKPAEFVEVEILYMKGGKPVGFGSSYAMDSDNEIKPGMTEYCEETSYEPFDSVIVCLSGRAD